MSNKELDNLFKSKLEKVSKKPSSDAWNKINTQIDCNDKKAFPFLKVAAAVVLLISFSFAIKYALDTNNSITDQTIAENNPQNTETKQDVDKPTTESISDETNKSDEFVAENNEVKIQDKNQSNETVTNKVVENSTFTEKTEEPTKIEKTNNNTPPSVEMIDQNETIAQITEENILPEATIEMQVASNTQKVEAEQSENKQKGQTIELNLSDFKKTAVVQNNQSQAESKADTARGFKKILNLMDEVGIGDLRKVKNELFALNSKKDNNANSK